MINRMVKRSLKMSKYDTTIQNREKFTDIKSGLDTFHLRRVWHGIRESQFRRRGKINSDYLTRSQ